MMSHGWIYVVVTVAVCWFAYGVGKTTSEGEARLTERNPNWREEERAESARRWDHLKAEGRLYERG